jgi:beta-galactosidase
MPNISYDGQSFILDGRRLWLVSGSIHYARVAPELWRARIRAAKEAGLNCIQTYVFWNVHEPRPAEFVFDGQADLRRFVQTVAEEEMYCIVRPGPFIAGGWDFGGLPPWLLKNGPIKLREAHPAFLEACSRYLAAVMEQLRNLQITRAGPGRATGRTANHVTTPSQVAGGPIVAMALEHQWFCNHEQQAEHYLGELMRYLREHGCDVPLLMSNNLWQRLDGAIDTWHGAEHLAANLRQLAVVQPLAPRMVSEYRSSERDCWGSPHHEGLDAQEHLHRLAQILASGGQYNIHMFHGGTNFGFYGGRWGHNPECFATTNHDGDAPLMEAGGRGEKYLATKRISTFASQFAHVFAHLRPDQHAATLAPDTEQSISVIHQSGSQGDVVFLLRSAADHVDSAKVLLPNGLTLPIPLGKERVAWLLLEANLGGVAQLDYTNLRPWAFVDKKMLVLFGPAGADAIICIDGEHHHFKVPTGREPRLARHEELVIVVLNTEQLDASYLHAEGLAVGCGGLDAEQSPLPLPRWATMYLIDLQGNVTRKMAAPPRRATPVKLIDWTFASTDPWLRGSTELFKQIDGPASLEQLGCDYGYGWYKTSVRQPTTGKILVPHSGDRLHLYCDGKLQGIAGVAPGATCEPAALQLRGEVVILADNLGRVCEGAHLGENKGLFGDIYAVQPVRLPKPRMQSIAAPDPFAVSGFVPHHRQGEHRPSESLIWKLKPAPRKPMIFEIRGLPADAMLVVNDQPVANYLQERSGHFLRYLLDPTAQGFGNGQNEVRLDLLSPLDQKVDPLKHVRVVQVVEICTARGPWFFSPWQLPQSQSFHALPKTPLAQPAWFRCRFTLKPQPYPLWLEPLGMSKGQIFLNGRNLGRYFFATHTGKPVPPQKLYYLPEPWLKFDSPNELLLFDEHGMNPSKCRLLYNAAGPYRK